MDRYAMRANPLRVKARFVDRKGSGGDGGIRRRYLETIAIIELF